MAKFPGSSEKAQNGSSAAQNAYLNKGGVGQQATPHSTPSQCALKLPLPPPSSLGLPSSAVAAAVPRVPAVAGQ